MGLKSDNSDAYALVYFLAFLSLFPGFKPVSSSGKPILYLHPRSFPLLWGFVRHVPFF